MNTPGGTHLTKQDRNIIQESLALNKTAKYISSLIDKSDRTVSNEIFKRRNRVENGRAKLTNREVTCKRLSRFPFVCNGCSKRKQCFVKNRYFYDSDLAHENYLLTLVSSREGLNMTLEEKIEFDTILKNGVDKGQSPYHIVTNNKDKIHCSVRTAYRIIDRNQTTIQNIDLRRKCKLKPRKKYAYIVDKSKIREGREYIDFIKYFVEHPGIGLVEVDTVEGPRDNPGKCLLTIHFIASHFMLGILLDSKTKDNVTRAFIELQETLGKKLYTRLFPLILTDRGSEFFDPLSIEAYYEDGEKVSNVFFCNSYASYQKGAIEENHTLVRYVIKKGTSLDDLTQEKIDLMMSHINSYSRESLNSKPYEIFKVTFGDEALKKVRISKINPNSINLTPKLVK